MLLVFLFLLIFIIFIILGIIFSKIEIDGRFEFDNLHNEKETNSFKYQIYINLYLFKAKYFRLMRLKINSEYLKLYKYKIKTKEACVDILKKIDINKIIKSLKIKYLKILKMKLSNICSNETTLANYLIEIFYMEKPSYSKGILWGLCGKQIYETILSRTRSFDFPVKNKSGEVEYLYEKYLVETI